MRKMIRGMFFVVLGGVFVALLFVVPGQQRVIFAEDNVDELESDISKLEKKLKKETAEYNALQQDLGQINSSLTSTQQMILRVQNMLNQTEQTIEQKEKEIANLEQQLVLERHVLTGLIQEMYLNSSVLLPEIMLSSSDFVWFLQGNDSLFSTQEKMQGVIQDINEMRSKVNDEKISLEDTKKDHAELLAIKNRQKQALVSEKVETQADLEDQQTIINRLKKELSQLQGDLNTLTGKSYNAKDIRDAVEYASGKTGVPKGVLYGFLKKETNMGANTGQCTYTEVEKVSIARYKKYGKRYQASINLLYKRQGIFYDIVDELGYGKNKKVSCSPNYIGQGGAMGVAQFMSDVWRGYEVQVASQTGHKNPDPWNLTDGVMAMALKLKRAGATSDSASAIRKASINYLGAFNANYYNGILYWSKNYKELFG
ncbi:MAG: lytic murein transglycosylase [bacterium]|nr:lytic murein transglycosylase [bacterium]